MDFHYFQWKQVFLMLVSASLLYACAKGQGEGGKGVVKGQVFVKDYNSSGDLVGEYFAQEERVYIIYGDNPVFDDEMKTNFDGTFEFRNLYRGSYTLFAYSKCDSCSAGTEAIFQTVALDKRGEEKEVPLITIIK